MQIIKINKANKAIESNKPTKLTEFIKITVIIKYIITFMISVFAINIEYSFTTILSKNKQMEYILNQF